MKYGPGHRPRTLVFLIAAPVDLLNLITLTSVFSYPKIDGKPAYATKILSANSEREVSGADGLAVINSTPFSEYTGPIHTLVVVGGEGVLHECTPELTRWIRRSAARSRRIFSVGSGTFMLASTGLLDGKRVTTHWHHVDRLAKQFPRLQVEKEPIYVKDANVYSSAGVAAGIDMALALIEEDFGHAEAISIARDLILYMRRSSNEAQHSTLLAQQAMVCGTSMRDLPAWAKTRITEKLDVNTLARVVAMSPRTFARQFDLRFQTTPARWVQALRVEAACTHLETEDLPLKAIARLTGFRDEQALRRAFQQQLSMTPKQYRDRFDYVAAAGHDEPDRLTTPALQIQ